MPYAQTRSAVLSAVASPNSQEIHSEAVSTLTSALLWTNPVAVMPSAKMHHQDTIAFVHRDSAPIRIPKWDVFNETLRSRVRVISIAQTMRNVSMDSASVRTDSSPTVPCAWTLMSVAQERLFVDQMRNALTPLDRINAIVSLDMWARRPVWNVKHLARMLNADHMPTVSRTV